MIQTKPLISVIIPIYNVELYLKDCIDSVLNQTYENLEIILVDDESPDKCPQICDYYAKLDKRIIVIHKKNGGLSSARNAGLKISRGDYISFIDSDDIIELNFYQLLLKYISTNSQVGISSCMFNKYINGNKFPYRKDWIINKERIIEYHDFAEKTLLAKSSFTVTNKLYKKEVLKNIYFREGRINEDTLFIFDLSKKIENLKINMIEIPYSIYNYRFREESICQNSERALEIETLKNYDEILEFYKIKNNDLYRKLTILYNEILINFCGRLLRNNNWKQLYWNKYYKKFIDIKLKDIKKIKYLIKYILIRFIKPLYIILTK